MLETLLLTAALGAGGPPAPPTPAPAERPVETVCPRAYPLKCASAQLAAPAVATDLRAAGLTARIAFDLPSNCLVVQGSPAAHARVAEFLPRFEEGSRTELRVFRLQHAPADAAQLAHERLVTSGVPVPLLPDARNNAFVVSGSRALQARAAAVVASFDLEPLPAPVPAAPAPAPREVPVLTASYHLRNVAANDAAVAVGRALGAGSEVRARPVENQLVVQGSPAAHARAVALVAELDRTVPQVVVQALVAQVPLTFLTDCGFAKASVVSLGKRERDLFNVALRLYPTREILSRPQIQVADGQTCHFQVGQTDPTDVAVAAGASPAGAVMGVSARVTPRIMPDGKVMLRFEPQVRTAVPRPAVVQAGNTAFPINVQTVQTTVLAADGETIVLVGPTVTGTDGKPAALLFVLTPHVVKSDKP
ncbi:MAG: hypothetical protein U0804_18900 [Gemmataceae bacterium]